MDAATALLEALAGRAELPPPVLSPTRTGGVLCEWERGAGQLEVEIESPDAAGFVYLDQKSGESVAGTLTPAGQPTESFLALAARLLAS